ncbi:exosortase-associated EpsI family protein [Calycomorphotria hydatis]|uniref:Methanolan biosynthesis EpsI domain-containing protein n=1 Tax=Calycomorphotria hydatis TaxID=2528027 RepID=A0A517T4L2_9PLAN|nr:exosortase-associated EpsI family protein [Calycomorphotria hydatis]QDT63304.1 hypothetical protein V22_05240 [Calycomorphotria hydatis]
MIHKYLPIILGFVVIIGVAIADGLRADRWGPGGELQEAADQLAAFPETLGTWESKSFEIPEDQLEVAGASGSISRHYRDRETGRVVTVMILCGRPGPIAVHPPTVCFTSSGLRLLAEPHNTIVATDGPNGPDEFLTADFAYPRDQFGPILRTYWGWFSEGVISAPSNPRIAFAPQPVLHKVYVTHDAVIGDKNSEQVGQSFMRVLLPALRETL